MLKTMVQDNAWTAAEDAALEAAIGAGSNPVGIPELQHRSPSEVIGTRELLICSYLIENNIQLS